MVAKMLTELKSTYRHLLQVLQVKMYVLLQDSNILRNIYLLGFQGRA